VKVDTSDSRVIRFYRRILVTAMIVVSVIFIGCQMNTLNEQSLANSNILSEDTPAGENDTLDSKELTLDECLPEDDNAADSNAPTSPGLTPSFIELTSQDIESFSDDDIRVIFCNRTLSFINFSGIDIKGADFKFSADSPDDALYLLDTILGWNNYFYVGETELYYTFRREQDIEERDFILVYKNSVYFTNYGLGDRDLPEALADRPHYERFADPSVRSIKLVYDTQYFRRSGGTSVYIASYVIQNEENYQYVLYRLTGNNAYIEKCTEVTLETTIFTIDSNTGIVIGYGSQKIKTVQLEQNDS